MKLPTIAQYRRTTEMAADDMVNEGGAIHQPSMRASHDAYEHLGRPSGWLDPTIRDILRRPSTMFWTGFVAGFAMAVLEERARFSLSAASRAPTTGCSC